MGTRQDACTCACPMVSDACFLGGCAISYSRSTITRAAKMSQTDSAKIGPLLLRRLRSKSSSRPGIVMPAADLAFFGLPRLAHSSCWTTPTMRSSGSNSTAGYDAHLLSVIPHMHWLGKDFILDSHPPRRAPGQTFDQDRQLGFPQLAGAPTNSRKRWPLPKGTKTPEIVGPLRQFKPRTSTKSSKPSVEVVTWGEQIDEMCTASFSSPATTNG